jgi:hypothetical protein
MEVVEDDSLRTELKRNKPPSGSINGDSPLSALRLYLSRWNITTGGSSSSDENSNINGNYDMIQQIQQMAQDMGVLGRGLSGDYDRPGGLPFGGGIGTRSDFGGSSSSSSSSSHGYWDDDFFPQFIELQWPPEGRLVERDCTCDFWERIRCKCIYFHYLFHYHLHSRIRSISVHFFVCLAVSLLVCFVTIVLLATKKYHKIDRY